MSKEEPNAEAESEFQPNGGRAWLATFGLLANVATELLYGSTLTASLLANPGWERYASRPDPGDATLAVAVYWCGLLADLTFVLAGTAFLWWIYRANQNARALGKYLRATPLISVVCWLIPIVALYRPFSVMKSLYLASRSLQAAEPDRLARVPGLWRIWWVSWLIGCYLGNFASRMAAVDGGSRGTAWAEVISVPFLVIAAACTTLIVRNIEALQEKAADSIDAGHSQLDR